MGVVAMKTQTLLDYSLNYLNRGWSIIPLNYKSKIPNAKLLPNGSWQEYQYRRPKVEEAHKWFSNGVHNIAIITGKISKIVVIDLDDEKAIAWAKANLDTNTLQVKTGRGLHLYYLYPNNGSIKNTTKIFGLNIDIRGDGGYCVAPPSVHESGITYMWINPNATIKSFPSILLEQQTSTTIVGVTPDMLMGVEKGQRNNTLAKIAGLCFGKGFSYDETVEYCLRWNMFNKPPLSEREVLKTVESIYKRELRKRATQKAIEIKAKKTSEPTLLQLSVEIIQKNVAHFFKDSSEEFFATIKDGSYYKLNSKTFKRLANQWIINELGRPVSAQTISDAIKNVEALQESKATKRSLSVRVATNEGSLYYDLGDFQSVKIDKGKWNIQQSPPIFYRFPHQLPQVEPDENATIDDIFKLFELINVTNEQHQILILTYLIYSFIPNLPYPILILFGSQGSGKSTAQRVLKSIIDPSAVDLLTFKGFDDLYTTLLHHHFLPIDNLSTISPALADEFCRISTGGGITKRQLYTDNELVFYTYKRPLSLSGINLVSSQPDLLDRALIINLERIHERLTEAELQKRLNELKPKILASIFSILAIIWNSLKNPPYGLLRMADFSSYGYNIAEVLGLGGYNFLKAYNSNRQNATKEIIENEPLATLILEWLERHQHFQGTPAGFLDELRNLAPELKLDEHLLPKKANSFKRKLNVLKTTLEDLGVIISEKHNGRERIFSIRKTEGLTEPIPEVLTDDEEMPF